MNFHMKYFKNIYKKFKEKQNKNRLIFIKNEPKIVYVKY